MSFEETIQEMYDHYPTLFKERWMALDHLFCVIGNGYEWINGGLADNHEKPSTDYQPVLDQHGKAFLSDEILREKLFQEYKEINDKAKEIFKQPDEALWKNVDRELKPSTICFYPLSKYSHIFNLPADIQHDWLEGVKETITLLLEYGFGEENDVMMNDFRKEEQKKYLDRLLTLKSQLQM
jgi:hypothetical protein